MRGRIPDGLIVALALSLVPLGDGAIAVDPGQPKGKDGELMPDGQFDLRITIASRAYGKRAAGHWTREAKVTGEGRPGNL